MHDTSVFVFVYVFVIVICAVFVFVFLVLDGIAYYFMVLRVHNGAW